MMQVGLTPDKILVADIDEASSKGENPKDYVKRMACEKSEKLNVNEHDFLVTADTIVSVGTQILHKTLTKEIARDYLKIISGRRHLVYSSFCIKHKNHMSCGIQKTIIKIKSLSHKEIEKYLETDQWKNMAGGYSIQGHAIGFLTFISGCYSSVVGLPVGKLSERLRQLGYRST